MHFWVLCVAAVVIGFVSAGVVDIPLARRALVARGDDDCGKGHFGGEVSSTTLSLFSPCFLVEVDVSYDAFA